jgi:hypothetical protein
MHLSRARLRVLRHRHRHRLSTTLRITQVDPQLRLHHERLHLRIVIPG